MNKLDLDYQNLLKDILENGTKKETRNGGTISIFGRQIRHKMSDGFPLLTTKKMPFKTIVTELLWFLAGRTDLKWLLDNDNTIWVGDAYKNYCKNINLPPTRTLPLGTKVIPTLYTQEEFINKIKTDDKFAKRWGELGPIYGNQWRNWNTKQFESLNDGNFGHRYNDVRIDQIQNLINDLKTNPDSRRLMVNAWNVGELDQMVLPPCHFSFQVYTRELSDSEIVEHYYNHIEIQSKWKKDDKGRYFSYDEKENIWFEISGSDIHFIMRPKCPTRAISLMWNQRSVDTFLGLPFNIASYGLLLEIIAKSVNMVPDELIGNLGDVHLYSNHVEQAKEQIGRELSLEERRSMVTQEMFNQIYNGGGPESLSHSEIDQWGIPRRTREPYPLPTLNINTEFWPYEGGECGVGPLDAVAIFNLFKNDDFCRCLLEEDIQLSNYQSHPSIKAPLSN